MKRRREAGRETDEQGTEGGSKEARKNARRKKKLFLQHIVQCFKILNQNKSEF